MRLKRPTNSSKVKFQNRICFGVTADKTRENSIWTILLVLSLISWSLCALEDFHVFLLGL